METIAEVKARYNGEYADVEVYEPMSRGKFYPDHFHTDNCRYTEEYTDDSFVGLYQVMDEEDYNNFILANSCEVADFKEWYGNSDTKVLCLMLA